jgi:hypothetical protein
VRCAPCLSGLPSALLRGYATVAAGSLILGAPLVALIVTLIALANLGVIGWQLVTFGQLMHRIIAAVARQAGLVPAAPVGRAAPPVGTPRTT